MANEREKMKPLFVYGTLCPGRSNAHILEAIGGEWRPGYVTGTFYARGWGAAADFRGSSSTLTAHGSTAICSCPIGWRRTGPCWTTLRRVRSGAGGSDHRRWTADQRLDLSASAPGVIPRRAARHGTAAQRDRESGVVSANAGILARCFLSFRHADDKTHLTRADAQSRHGQQQKNG